MVKINVYSDFWLNSTLIIHIACTLHTLYVYLCTISYNTLFTLSYYHRINKEQGYFDIWEEKKSGNLKGEVKKTFFYLQP